ncbi:RNA polymerase sigma factor [Pseudaestuariivita rosea]|uniref:RNA polymerase sigma factor n=1 Tax=Pseudaestuariivita rosea TaxID=2763263 RepID=UPI001F174099|nr:RNA polymerase sigma factor [Pseudaestuariivita rosea]
MGTTNPSGVKLPKTDPHGIEPDVKTRHDVGTAAIAAKTGPKQINAVAMTPDQFKTQMIGLLPRLRRFALSLTRSGPDADDLLQEACTIALQRWQQYDPAQPMDRWMFRIVRNLWISEVRKRKTRQGQGQVPAEEATELQSHGTADDMLTAQQIRGKVDNLDPELAQPLMLVCAEGYSYRETSELLDIPIGTVMSRIHRARKLLISSLSEEGYVAQ